MNGWEWWSWLNRKEACLTIRTVNHSPPEPARPWEHSDRPWVSPRLAGTWVRPWWEAGGTLQLGNLRHSGYPKSEHIRMSRSVGPVLPAPEEERGRNIPKPQEGWLCGDGCLARAEVSGQGMQRPAARGSVPCPPPSLSLIPFDQIHPKAREPAVTQDVVLSSPPPAQSRTGPGGGWI